MFFFSVLLRLCCLFATLAFVEAHQKYGYVKVPVTEPCVLKIEERTTETLLRASILMGDLEAAAKILSESNETFSLAAGLTYTPEQECFIQRSQNPTQDPDVVAIQAVALSAERTGETDKLATLVVTSFQTPCECPLFTPRELDEMRSAIKAILDDPLERKLILEFNGTEEEPVAVPEQEKSPPPKEKIEPSASSGIRISVQQVSFPDVSEEPKPDVFPETPANPRPTVSPVIPAEPKPIESPIVPANPRPTVSLVIPEEPEPVESPTVPASPVPIVSPVIPEEPEPVESPTVPASPVPIVSLVIPAEPEPVESPTTTINPQVSSDVRVITDDKDDVERDDSNVDGGDGEDDDDEDDDDEEGDGDDDVKRRGRRLLVTDASPTNSFYCAFCRPAGPCSPLFWC